MLSKLKSFSLSHERLTVFSVGAFGYGACELLCRGFTHWTMLVAGGICLLGIYEAEKKYGELNIALRCFFGSVYITSIELIFGCVVNLLLGWEVWDYSEIPFNFLGQICLKFFFLWFLFCFAIFYICKKLRRFYGEGLANAGK